MLYVCADLRAATDPAGERVWGPGLCGKDTQGHTQPQHQHSTCTSSHKELQTEQICLGTVLEERGGGVHTENHDFCFGICAIICTRREIQCVLYARYFLHGKEQKIVTLHVLDDKSSK